VDRAALDLALELGIPCGGWCPKGRKAEDGRLDPRYPLRETLSQDYPQRTEWNVRDSDGTLVLAWGAPSGGTAFTIELAGRYKKPCLIMDLLKEGSGASEVLAWLKLNKILVLNVAGPRESLAPGAYSKAKAFLRKVFQGM